MSKPVVESTETRQMDELDAELRALADHLRVRQDAILQSWRSAVKKDPELTSSDPLPRHELYDHLPALLVTFEQRLAASRLVDARGDTVHQYAAAHGLQRWQQGYDLREVTRELGKLNEAVVAELDAFVEANPRISHGATAAARRLWATLCSTGIEESVSQYFQLQQQEAAGHVSDLEQALVEVRELEQQRGDLWRQAAHDLRGNLGVVANATVGLTHTGLQESSRDTFVRILMRNVTSLHHLLDDVTSLARLQAGREERCIERIDVAAILQQLCEGIRPIAQQRRLFLRGEGPAGFAADGDAVKIRRIAQNLILNSVKFTREGGITVSWGDSDRNDPKRWLLCIRDTGPGFHSASAAPILQALGKTIEVAHSHAASNIAAAQPAPGPAAGDPPGEGLGLSIVKRLCDMLDATVDIESEPNVGSVFRIHFPRTYA
jgi:signal transduction histidine kinase